MSIIMDKKLNSPWVDWIIVERKKKGWNQSRLAKEAGVSRATISDYELGRRQYPEPDTLSKVATALKNNPEELLRLAGILPPVTSTKTRIEKMLYKLDLLPPKVQERIDRQIDFELTEIERVEKENAEEDKEI